jgi:hypothetical protein
MTHQFRPVPKCSVESCDRDSHARGFCGKHYGRWRQYGDPTARPRTGRQGRTSVQWWSDKVRLPIDPCGCWLWTGRLDKDGYGVFSTGRAHRWSYVTFVGPIPEGKQLDHKCRVRNCVNPEHLEPVTLRENLMRGTGYAAIAVRKTHCLRGHPLSGGNLLPRPGSKRNCRECANARERTQSALERRAARRRLRYATDPAYRETVKTRSRLHQRERRASAKQREETPT